MIAPGQALRLSDLIVPTPDGIASRVLGKTSGGNLTLFALDAGQGLTEHTSPFEALVIVLEGTCTLTIGGTAVRATPGTIVRMPADIPHALEAVEATRLLLVMLREQREKVLARIRGSHRPVVCRARLDGRPHLPGGAARSRARRHDRRRDGHRPRRHRRRARTSGSRWAAWRSARSGATAATSPPTGPPTGCTARRSFILDALGAGEHRSGLRRARPESSRPQLQSRLATADADRTPTTRPRGTVTVDPVRAEAFEANLAHYADVFAQRATPSTPSRRARSPTPTAAAAGRLLLLDLVGGVDQPAGTTTITYTNNWPHEPLVGNRPTGDAVVWTGVSIIVLLAGIGGDGLVVRRRRREDEPPPSVPEADPLLGSVGHAVAAGDGQVLLGRVAR